MSYTLSVEKKLIISDEWGATDLTFYTGDVKLVTKKLTNPSIFYGSLNLYCDDPGRITYFIPHGKGVLYNDINGEKKYGDVTFERGILDGQCTIYNDETGTKVYEGNYKNNQPNGFGKLYTYSDEYQEYVIYEGEWKNGMKNGNGYSHEFADAIYDGEWENNMRNGYGQHFINNNQVIACTWKNDKKNGFGLIELGNDRYMIDCKWIDDKLVNPGIEVIRVRKSKRNSN